MSFAAMPGDVVQVRGSNGSGKSSLLRLLCGLLQPTRGDVRWCGQSIGPIPSESLGSIAYMGHASGMSGELTVLENLRFSLHVANSAFAQTECREVLGRLGLARRSDTCVRFLSQGQQQRLSLARVILSRRPLWLLDEPSASLDEEGEELFDEYLSEHARGGRIAVVATHRDLGDGPGALSIDMDAFGDAGSLDSVHHP
ncbi:heme ABC exporter ATP-binding protein CcmA [Ramlibacter sp. PS3R-8]